MSAGAEKPGFLIWIVTGRCNLRCSHCYASRFCYEHDELGVEDVFALADAIVDAGIERVNLAGGEFLITDYAIRLIEYLSRRCVLLSLITNGTTINERVASVLADNNVFVYLSIDGACRRTHERIRGIGTWEKVIRAVELLNRQKVAFSTIIALNVNNYNEVRQYLQFVKRMGAVRVCIIPVMSVGRAEKDIVLTPLQIMEVIRIVDESAEELRLPVSFWCVPFAGLFTRSKFVTTSYCRRWEDEIEIDPAGNVLLCDILDIKVANVKREGFIGAWNKLNRFNLLNDLMNPDLPLPCSKCEIKDRCLGGCYARAALKRNIFAPDPLCPVVSGDVFNEEGGGVYLPGVADR